MILLLILILFAVVLIAALWPHPQPIRTASIKVIFQAEGELMADLVLQVGQSSVGTVVPFLADGVTQTPGAVVSAQVWTISDPALVVTSHPDGTVTVAATAATAADVNGSVKATVTDSDGFTQELSKDFTISVGGVTPPVNRTAGIGVSWSNPS